MNTTGSTPLDTETTNGSSSAQDVTEENPSPSDSTEPKKLEKLFPVIELFGPVIQGEGSQAGQQTMFIRFGGCDYRCTKCDSMHAVEPKAIQKHRTMMSARDIANNIIEVNLKTGVKWVTFSGGNPCMHDLTELVARLHYQGFHINVETQGTLWQDWLYKCTLVTVSPKSMGIGEKFEKDKYMNFLRKLQGLRPLCLKVVVFSAQDLEMALWMKDLQEQVYNEGAFPRNTVAYYLSLGNPYPPVLNEDLDLVESPELEGVDQVKELLSSYRELSEEVLLDPRMKDFKFLPQLHVLVYGNEASR